MLNSNFLFFFIESVDVYLKKCGRAFVKRLQLLESSLYERFTLRLSNDDQKECMKDVH